MFFMSDDHRISEVLQLFEPELEAKSLIVLHQYCSASKDGVHAVLSGNSHVVIAGRNFRDAAVAIAPRVLWAGSVYDPRLVELFAFLDCLGVGDSRTQSKKPIEALKQEVASYRGARARINEFFEGELSLGSWRDVMNSRFGR